ncbi:hypothetical protein KDL01_26085 [Actinospica durhamensis]|uniref:Uncharacterized protein n=1 Tax=Actinospica durhamensis TaxID=1508375 RepID=A0A941ERP1_9ACTN|nr:hypothetical protein [Actinospica durhamensis]MBR7836777.1 hypothetical protein [Actinospica durhamensis]
MTAETVRAEVDAQSDDVAALSGWELRPLIGVSALREGIHLRGRRSSVTLEGSRALPALWRMLEQALRTGDHAALLRQAPADSALRKALGTLVAQLHAHDLLVERSAAAHDPAAASRWLRAVADQPDAAAAAIAALRPQVLASDPGSALAQAAGRALRRCGASPLSVASDAVTDPGRIVLVASVLAVAAGLAGGTAFVTAPGSPEQVRADAAELTARLGLTSAPGWSGGGSAAQTAMVAGAAAQRLLCAIAGLPDPADEGDDQRILPDRPAVLIITDRPAQAGYHSWLGPDLLDPDRAAVIAPPDTLGEALRRIAALGDDMIGPLAPPLPGALPQLPAALASCPVPGGILVAGAARLDLARLDAICRAAELRLAVRGLSSDSGAGPEVAVGVDPGHAWGRALRRAAGHALAQADAGLPQADTGSPAQEWLAHPQARHWWTTLTERLGARARLSVARTAPDEDVFHAAVRDDSGALLGQAVEATAGDAAAFAALAATVQLHASAQSATDHRISWPSGACAPITAAKAQYAGWEDDGWTTRWLAGVAAREPAFQTALRRQTGLRIRPWEPVHADARAVAAGLHGCGFAVLCTDGGRR